MNRNADKGERRTVKKMIALAAVLAWSCIAADKNPWATFKPGSWVKWKTTTDMTVAGRKNSTSMDTKMTLISKATDKVTVESEVSVMGHPTKTRTDIPLNAKAGNEKAAVPVKTGSETITVAGKTFKCTTAEVHTEANGAKTVTKTWVADEVPGGVVKTESTTTGPMNSKMTMELVDFKSM